MKESNHLTKRTEPCPCCNECVRVVDGEWAFNRVQWNYCNNHFGLPKLMESKNREVSEGGLIGDVHGKLADEFVVSALEKKKVSEGEKSKNMSISWEKEKCKCGHQRKSHHCAHYFGEDHYGRCRFCECQRFEEEASGGKTK